MDLNYRVFGTAEFVLGRGSLNYLGTLKKERVALIVDSGALTSGGFMDKIKTILEQAGSKYEVIADINREPYISDLEEPIQKIRAFQPDCIVAIGGGSVLDTGKALAIFYEHQEITWDQVFTPFAIPPMGKKAVSIAVPTTSGTGSETTFVAVFTDDETKKKRLIMSREIIPHYAIIDPDLTDSMPSQVAAHSGMDAFAHAMEAAVCKASSPMVVSISLATCLDIIDWLPASVYPDQYPKKAVQARENMHVAATMAGMAIANTCAGLAHALDQPGPYFGIPHGLVCGILLPYTTNFVLPNPAYSLMAKRLGFEGDDIELGKQLVAFLWDFNQKVGIPTSFKDVGISENEYLKKLDDFIELALNAMSAKLAPVTPTPEQARKIFIDAYFGKKPV